MGGGELESTSPLRFLPFTQKIFLRPIPEISKLLVADTPLNLFPKNLVYTLLQHFRDTLYKNNFDFLPIIKNLLTNPT